MADMMPPAALIRHSRATIFPAMNYFRTALLLAALTGFFLVVGYLLGGQAGLMIALVVALRHEPVRLLEQRQDGAAHEQRAGGRTAARRPSSTASSSGWPSAPACRCRASI